MARGGDSGVEEGVVDCGTGFGYRLVGILREQDGGIRYAAGKAAGGIDAEEFELDAEG